MTTDLIERLVSALEFAHHKSGVVQSLPEVAEAIVAGHTYLTEARARLAEPKPIDMVLHCPNCGKQHIDAPEWKAGMVSAEGYEPPSEWTNPPHRSHQCHYCKGPDGKPFVWRPADVPTNGVAAVKTRGKADSPMPTQRQEAGGDAPGMKRRHVGKQHERPPYPR